MRVVNFNSFINEAVNHDYLEQSVSDCLVELRDIGLDVRVKKVRNNFIGIGLYITVTSKLSEKFRMIDLKESFDMMIDLLDDGYTYNVLTKFRLVFNNRPKYNDDYDGYYLANVTNVVLNMDIDLFELEVTNVKGNSNIRSYESYDVEDDLTKNYNRWVNNQNQREKILQEVDELLVELSDINFDVSRNFIIKDGKNILELWIEREVPDFEDDQDEDWYYDKEDIFTIGEVFEPLALLTDWMREKYSADLVDDEMHSDTFTFDGTLNDSMAEVFDPEWKELQRKWFGENYLKKRVSALFVKYVW